MIYTGDFIELHDLSDGYAELVFANHHKAVNILNQATLAELAQALARLRQLPALAGLLVSSAHRDFILGADITEFLSIFALPEDKIRAHIAASQQLLSELETLPCPTVAAIDGQALGGGLELCLALDYRLLGEAAEIGLPEVKLGIIPGWGGTLRLPRLIGAETALHWIVTGEQHSAGAALQVGAVDAVVASGELRAAGLDVLAQCRAAKLDYLLRRKVKQRPLPMNGTERELAFIAARGQVLAQAGRHYPAPLAAVELLQQTVGMEAAEALALESASFAKLAKTEVCSALVGLFLNGQELKRVAKAAARSAQPCTRAAVLGAGIMGGGIAYQVALKGVPVVMRDISEKALQAGMQEAIQQLDKRVARGKLSPAAMATLVSTIQPSLELAPAANADIIIEAVVENAAIKQQVLAEVEGVVAPEAVITSNTSTIAIDHLAQALRNPERFCGMHFFNPVPVMPLVEVVRGSASSDATIARVVAFAAAIGKTPVVVKDCPGFLVNRVLFPYLLAFNLLLRDGADFRRVDKTMEAFGWPMGPAYLMDVIGLDTCRHAAEVLAQGYPERMAQPGPNVMDMLYEAGYLGQKSGKGFYAYQQDRKGRPQKCDNPDIDALLAQLRVANSRPPMAPRTPVAAVQSLASNQSLSDQSLSEQPATLEQSFTPAQIIERLMLPLCLETARCLEQGVVASAAEADMALVLGIGFPKFRGGALRYADSLGLAALVASADRYASLGPLYEVSPGLRQMAAAGQAFFA